MGNDGFGGEGDDHESQNSTLDQVGPKVTYNFATEKQQSSQKDLTMKSALLVYGQTRKVSSRINKNAAQSRQQ